MEPVFRRLEIAAEAATRVTGTRITYGGLDNILARGGAVVAIIHTGYIDFLPAALAAKPRRRRMRFMIKAEMEEVKIVGYLIRHTGTIPVDRRAGAGAYAVAVQALCAGELVGVCPLRASMNALLERAQQDYPAPAGQYWVPRGLGGGAPTLEQARGLEEVELAERSRRRADGRGTR